jgi:hypothetical protein
MCQCSGRGAELVCDGASDPVSVAPPRDASIRHACDPVVVRFVSQMFARAIERPSSILGALLVGRRDQADLPSTVQRALDPSLKEEGTEISLTWL